METNQQIILNTLETFSKCIDAPKRKAFVVHNVNEGKLYYSVTWGGVSAYVKNHWGCEIVVKPAELTYVPRRISILTEDGKEIVAARTHDYKYEQISKEEYPFKGMFGLSISQWDIVRLPGSIVQFEVKFISNGKVFLCGDDGTEIEVKPEECHIYDL